MTEKQDQFKKKLQRVGEGLKSMRYTLRQVMGLTAQPMRERVSAVIEAKRQPQGQPQTQGNPQQTTPQVQERFMNRPRILESFFQPSQPEQPQFTPEEMIILEERQQQILEDAELRKQQEEDERKAEEKRKALKRAREKMSFGNM